MRHQEREELPLRGPEHLAAAAPFDGVISQSHAKIAEDCCLPERAAHRLRARENCAHGELQVLEIERFLHDQRCSLA